MVTIAIRGIALLIITLTGLLLFRLSDLRGKIIYFVICYIVVLFAAEYLNEALAKIKRPPDDPTRQL